MKRIAGALLAVLCGVPAVFALPPVVHFTDIVSGPATGGKDGRGAFVTVVGKNFGASQGAGYVSIGGGRADNYPVWSDTKITFQLGSAAASGAIVVTTPDGASNGLPFTVRGGAIYFVSAASPADPGSGTYADPWRSGSSFFAAMHPGDICYFRAGVYNNKMGDQGGRANITAGGSAPDGTANNEIAWIAYPGEVARLETGQGNIRSSVEMSKSYYVIAGFQMYSQGSVIELGGRNNRIINNTCEGVKQLCYGNIHTNGGNGNKVYGNELLGARSANKLDHMLYVAYGEDNLDFGWNFMHDNDIAVGPAISINTDGAQNSGTVFENIRLHDNRIDCRKSSSALRALGIVETARGSSVYFYNNVVIEGGSDVSYYSGIYQYSGSGYIYNNTFYNVKGPYVFTVTNSDTYRPETVDVRNNIFYRQGGQSYISIQDEKALGKLIIGNNCYYGSGAGPATDTHPVNADPLFVDPSNGDFHLGGGSPCIDAGADVSSVVGWDKDGVPRPQGGAFDIGAYEYLSGTSYGGYNIPATGISGYVTNERGEGIAGVGVSISGDVQQSTVTASGGLYHFADVPKHGNYTVSPSTIQFSFSPARRSTASFSGAISGWDFSQSFSSTAVTIPQDRVRVVGSTASKGAINPDRGESAMIYFKGERKGKFECRIFTLTGDMVWSDAKQDVTEGVFEWKARDIASGIYIANVVGPGIQVTKKIAVLR